MSAEPSHYGFVWSDSRCPESHSYLAGPVIEAAKAHFRGRETPHRVFDLGCGNGTLANLMTEAGLSVRGVDPSETGIRAANRAFPHLDLKPGSAYDDLAGAYGNFPVVTSLEVVEHVYDPYHYAATLFSLVEPGGIAILSTPYHSYLKNLALAVTGKMETHFNVLETHGHIKFWSIKTLTTLLTKAGFEEFSWLRAGRIPSLAKSMLVVARKGETAR